MIETQVEIHQGVRGKRFENFLKQIFKLSRTFRESDYMKLLDKEGMIEYDKAFTHSTANKDENYEYYEFTGDGIVNGCVSSYLSQRCYDDLKLVSNEARIKILSRLKINTISKRSFATFAKKLGFWEYVTMSVEIKNTQMDKTLEDVFEAFFGCTFLLCEKKIFKHVGHAVCSSILESILNQFKTISYKYEDLFDAKTRLKEIFDYFKNKNPSIGTLKYKFEKIEKIHYVNAVRIVNNQEIKLGYGQHALKASAEQVAAENSIKILNRMGFSKELPEEYIILSRIQK